MREIKGYGEIYLPLGDNYYDEATYDISDFDIELIGWDRNDGYNRDPIFRLTPKKDEDDETAAED